MTVLNGTEMPAHCCTGPAGIAGQRRNLIPVGVWRGKEDHCVVGGAATQAGGAWVQYTTTRRPIVWVTFLLCGIGVVANEKITAQRGVFGREGMKGWHVIIIR